MLEFASYLHHALKDAKFVLGPRPCTSSFSVLPPAKPAEGI
jgi:hypothetical protein